MYFLRTALKKSRSASSGCFVRSRKFTAYSSSISGYTPGETALSSRIRHKSAVLSFSESPKAVLYFKSSATTESSGFFVLSRLLFMRNTASLTGIFILLSKRSISSVVVPALRISSWMLFSARSRLDSKAKFA